MSDGGNLYIGPREQGPLEIGRSTQAPIGRPRTLTVHETAKLIAATVKNQCAAANVIERRQALAAAETSARLSQLEMQEVMRQLGLTEGDTFDMATGIVKAVT